MKYTQWDASMADFYEHQPIKEHLYEASIFMIFHDVE